MIVGLIAFALSLAFTTLITRIAHASRVYDFPDHRKLHSGPRPSLGGVAIVLAFFFAVGGAYEALVLSGSPAAVPVRYYGFALAGLFLMHVIGVVDDAVDIPPFGKLFLQFVPALIIAAGGAVIEAVRVPLSQETLSLGVAAVPVTVLWIVGVSTAVNLIDGIDGFAGGIALVAAAAFGVLALLEGNALNAAVAFAFVGAVGGFLVFNLPPARIFMGDGGSLFAGALLAVLAITRSGPGDGAMSFLFAPVVLAIPLIDTFAAVGRRVRRGVALHQPDREHVHHVLLHHYKSVRKALSVGYPMAVVVAAAAVAYVLAANVATLALAVAAPAALIAVYVRLDRPVGREVREQAKAASELTVAEGAQQPAQVNGAATGQAKKVDPAQSERNA